MKWRDNWECYKLDMATVKMRSLLKHLCVKLNLESMRICTKDVNISSVSSHVYYFLSNYTYGGSSEIRHSGTESSRSRWGDDLFCCSNFKSDSKAFVTDSVRLVSFKKYRNGSPECCRNMTRGIKIKPDFLTCRRSLVRLATNILFGVFSGT